MPGGHRDPTRGFRVQVLEEGFNDRNKYGRESPCHGDTLRHLLLSTGTADMIAWFNNSAGPRFKRESAGRTRHYIIDGVRSCTSPPIFSINFKTPVWSRTRKRNRNTATKGKAAWAMFFALMTQVSQNYRNSCHVKRYGIVLR